MTATRGAINVMLASKSQLQKVVLPPLRRASQRVGLPPGPPRPTRPPAAQGPQGPLSDKVQQAYHTRLASCMPQQWSYSRQQAEPAHRHVVGMGTAVQQWHLSWSTSERVGMQKWLVIDTYIQNIRILIQMFSSSISWIQTLDQSPQEYRFISCLAGS